MIEKKNQDIRVFTFRGNMMNLIVQKTKTLQGSATPPGSKSQSIREILLALLSTGESVLENILDSDDTRDAIKVCQDLGAKITQGKDKNKLIIKSQGLPLKPKKLKINSGNSGITTRFIMPLLGLRQDSDQPIILDCAEQMRLRPIESLVAALRHLGLSIEYLKKANTLPISITGNLMGGNVEIEGITSQYLSALLIALPLAEQDSEILVKDLHERPYMQMTLSCLDKQKIFYTHEYIKNTDIYHIPGKQSYHSFHTHIGGDFSSASYLIAAAVLLDGHVELHGLNMQDSQGDKRLVLLLQEMGADIVIEPTKLIIQGGKTLRGIKIDANDIPDLLPTLAVIGTQVEGKIEIYNVKQARIKETDRIHSMTEGLRSLGAHIDEFDDGMTVYKSRLQGGKVKGFGDHRTVMALSIAGLLSTHKTIIEDSEAIHKTFPDFVKIMQSLGANIETSVD